MNEHRLILRQPQIEFGCPAVASAWGAHAHRTHSGRARMPAAVLISGGQSHDGVACRRGASPTSVPTRKILTGTSPLAAQIRVPPIEARRPAAYEPLSVSRTRAVAGSRLYMSSRTGLRRRWRTNRPRALSSTVLRLKSTTVIGVLGHSRHRSWRFRTRTSAQRPLRSRLDPCSVVRRDSLRVYVDPGVGIFARPCRRACQCHQRCA